MLDQMKKITFELFKGIFKQNKAKIVCFEQEQLLVETNIWELKKQSIILI